MTPRDDDNFKPYAGFAIFSGMKIFHVFFLLMICEGNVFGQKEQSIWVGGAYSAINFSSGTATPFTRPYYQNVWRTGASVCDSDGNLLFFTNGFRIFNRDYQIMKNGDSLNIGDYLSWGYDELAVPDGAVIIPKVDDPGKYYLFHVDLDYVNVPYGDSLLFSKHLYYSVIDMNLDGGKGEVVTGEKEISILSDTLTNTGIQAVKHGNGQDWWLYCHEYGANNYYRFLIDKSGINGPYTQSIGMVYSNNDAYTYAGNNIKINQEGNKLAKGNTYATLVELFDLDRCTGELSNETVIRVSDTLYGLMGLSFSPGGRYLYTSANYWQYLFQFDLQSLDIDSSKVLIAKYSDTSNHLGTDFYDHALGADGKIYITAYDTWPVLHVINNPDSAGKKCNFIINGLQLTAGWGGGMPNLPNYHLSSLEGSGCDTVITNVSLHNVSFEYEVSPNPCTGKFQLSITGVSSKAEIVIYNTMGEVIEQTSLQPVNGFIHGFFNLQNQPSGVYLLKAHTSRGDFTMKILKG